jgi:5-methylcytosine-specific restriction endonuclease McrA
MSQIPALLRRLVIRRAAERCEYCKLSQAGQEATFHIDHVIPIAAGGLTIAENLALACVSCLLRKGARTTVNDRPFRELMNKLLPCQKYLRLLKFRSRAICPLA